MTSNTAPYGTASAYQVFDGNANTTVSGTDFSYKFVNPICPKSFYCNISGGTLQASNDGSTWSVPTSGSYYLYLRLHFASSVSPHTLQFYGRELSVSVPTMTGNTTPYGEVGGNRYVTGDTLDLYGAFNQVTSNYTQVQNGGKIYYKFNKPTVIKKVGLFTYSSISDYVNNMQLVGSNDNGATWQNIGTAKTPISQQAIQYFDYADNEEPFSIIGISVNAPNNSHNPAITILQFYGLDYSEKEFEEGTTKKWLYDHGVELETMYIDSAIGEKKDSFLRYSKPDSQTYATAMCTTNNPINISPFSILRAKSGYWGYNSAANGQITLGIVSQRGYTPLVAYRDNTPTDAPNNLYLVVSNVNETNYVGFGWGAKAAVNFDIKEIWLE
jgi:hypothetical protein